HLGVERAHTRRHLRHGGGAVGHEGISLNMRKGSGADRHAVQHRKHAGRAGWCPVTCRSPGTGSQPLTAPVSPPTIRRSKSEKNTSAGIIDNEVKARTAAVSTEY